MFISYLSRTVVKPLHERDDEIVVNLCNISNGTASVAMPYSLAIERPPAPLRSLITTDVMKQGESIRDS